MKKTKNLYTLYQWEMLCRIGLGEETEDYLDTLLPIECPNYETLYTGLLEQMRPCKAKLKDVDGQAYHNIGQKRKKVWCPTCHWKGSRAVGKRTRK